MTLANALNKHRERYCLLSTSHCKFNGACSCTHTQKTIPLAPIHLFTKQIVPSLSPESLIQSLVRSLSPVPLIKGFLPSITFLHARCFSCLFLSFSSHTFFVGLQELALTLEVFFQTNFLCIHLLVK